ncbi:PTS sugar transporter subunit IIA, partial [Xanthomonas cissicola]|uniref:PTS sugar transporter subunit IIA n=1 Tax=Xanthomonas cissicola TaxID=86186 RepID=UPI001117A46A
MSSPSPAPVTPDLVRLRASARDKDDAIAQAAQLLVAAGSVAPGYEASMRRRQGLVNNVLGYGLA